MSYEGRLFFKKGSKFDLDFRNKANNWERSFCFLDNWMDNLNGLWAAVNMLTNSAEISDITKKEIFQLNFPWSYEQIL